MDFSRAVARVCGACHGPGSKRERSRESDGSSVSTPQPSPCPDIVLEKFSLVDVFCLFSFRSVLSPQKSGSDECLYAVGGNLSSGGLDRRRKRRNSRICTGCEGSWSCSQVEEVTRRKKNRRIMRKGGVHTLPQSMTTQGKKVFGTLGKTASWSLLLRANMACCLSAFCSLGFSVQVQNPPASRSHTSRLHARSQHTQRERDACTCLACARHACGCVSEQERSERDPELSVFLITPARLQTGRGRSGVREEERGGARS